MEGVPCRPPPPPLSDMYILKETTCQSSANDDRLQLSSGFCLCVHMPDQSVESRAFGVISLHVESFPPYLTDLGRLYLGLSISLPISARISVPILSLHRMLASLINLFSLVARPTQPAYHRPSSTPFSKSLDPSTLSTLSCCRVAANLFKYYFSEKGIQTLLEFSTATSGIALGRQTYLVSISLGCSYGWNLSQKEEKCGLVLDNK